MTTSSRVERAVRHAIKISFERGNKDLIEEIFQNAFSTQKGKATNAEFIFGLADYIISCQ